MADQEQQAAEFPKINFDQLPNMRETIVGIIGLICYSDAELRATLIDEGINSGNVAVVMDKVKAFYKQMGQDAPDLSWMKDTTFNIHKNDENNYVIPLPHTE